MSELKGISGRERGAKRQRRATEILDFRASIGDAVQELSLLVRHLVGGASDQDGGVFRRDPLRSVGPCGRAAFPPVGHKARHYGALALVAFFPNFFIQKRCVVASFIPSLLEVGAKLIYFWRRPVWRLGFWKLAAAERAANGRALNSEGAADGRL